jgi:hypothetical protein
MAPTEDDLPEENFSGNVGVLVMAVGQVVEALADPCRAKHQKHLAIQRLETSQTVTVAEFFIIGERFVSEIRDWLKRRGGGPSCRQVEGLLLYVTAL